MRSLRFKVALSYLVLVAITVAISIFAAVQFSRMDKSIGRILSVNYGSIVAAENMLKALDGQENAQVRLSISNLAQRRLEFQNGRNDFYEAYGQANNYAQDDTTDTMASALLDSIIRAYDSYITASDTLFAVAQTEPFGVIQTYREIAVHPLAADVRRHTFSLLEVNQGTMDDTQEAVQNVSDRATTGVIAVAILAVALSLLAVIRFARQIVLPIGILTDTIRRIGRGQIGQKVVITSDDEIAELEREFNKMMERLQTYEAMNVQQLIAEKKKSESLVQTMPNPVIVTNQEDQVLLLNRAAVDLLGLQNKAWQERPLQEVVTNKALLQHMAGSGDGELHDPVLYLPQNGSGHYYRRRQVPIHNADGNVDLMVTMLEDVTRFKELDQLKSDFLAAVSHELRTPLTSAGMAIDLLLQEVPGSVNAVQRDLLETLRDDSERLKRLVSSLLNLARLESGTYRPAQEAIRMDHVVEDAVAPLLLPFREKGVALENNIPSDLPPITGDAEHLGWVVTNLVGNALRHTPEGGTVHLSASSEDGVLHVQVTDTGPGIPAGSLEAIFEKFIQLKPSNQTTPGSVGLGLALARRVVEAHNGKIWAESEPGVGSVFHFTLPRDL
jgi:two-component system, NtrC family, sensor histidine kinase KinB